MKSCGGIRHFACEFQLVHNKKFPARTHSVCLLVNEIEGNETINFEGF